MYIINEDYFLLKYRHDERQRVESRDFFQFQTESKVERRFYPAGALIAAVSISYDASTKPLDARSDNPA
jgi:hypothetical protein